MRRSWSILKCPLGRGLRGLGEQQARPAHDQTVPKDLLSPLGGWEGQAQLTGGPVREPMCLSRGRSSTPTQDRRLPFTKFSTMLNLKSTKTPFQKWVLSGVCVCASKADPRARSGPTPTACQVGIWEMSHQRPE